MKDINQRIYDVVRNIPVGSVMTYGQIAIQIGNKNLARAVGNALHKNPNPEIIPCHRVVNSKGYLSKNYAFGGIEEQRKKLILENIEFITKYQVKL